MKSKTYNNIRGTLAKLALCGLLLFFPLQVNTASAITCEGDMDASTGLCLPKSPFDGKKGIAGSSTIGEAVAIVLKVLLTAVGVVAVLWLIVSGFQYMTAGGNEEQAEKARKGIMNAIIGLVVVVLSYAIVRIVTDFLIKGT